MLFKSLSKRRKKVQLLFKNTSNKGRLFRNDYSPFALSDLHGKYVIINVLTLIIKTGEQLSLTKKNKNSNKTYVKRVTHLILIVVQMWCG